MTITPKKEKLVLEDGRPTAAKRRGDIVLALGAIGRLAHFLHGRQEQPNENADDGDDHQQIDQRERGTRTSHDGNSSITENEYDPVEPRRTTHGPHADSLAQARTKRFVSTGARTYGLSMCCGRGRIRERDEEDDRWKRDAPSGARIELPRSEHYLKRDSKAGESPVGPILKSSPIQSKWEPKAPAADASNEGRCRNKDYSAVECRTWVPLGYSPKDRPRCVQGAWDNCSRHGPVRAQAERGSDMPTARRRTDKPDVAGWCSPSGSPSFV
jgi:hypothetical protein